MNELDLEIKEFGNVIKYLKHLKKLHFKKILSLIWIRLKRFITSNDYIAQDVLYLKTEINLIKAKIKTIKQYLKTNKENIEDEN